MAPYDIVGSIVIVKFKRGESAKKKNEFASKFLKEHKNITTVVEKVAGFKGRLRKQGTKFILGTNTKEVLYRENGCEFRFNIDTCYFSPRLSSEREKIAGFVKKGEDVLVMFGGVAPFAIVIAKRKKAGKIVSVELNRECTEYALENVKRNKVNVEIVQGDVRRVVGKGKKISEKFDRIVMARPNLEDSFLDVAFKASKKNGIIHYYGFYPEREEGKLRELIDLEAKKAKRKIKLLRIERAGDIGPYEFRYRADFKVLN